ncbi:altronate hydrolase [Chitinophaga terrae (ex Kim and Jung 2007)]|uniref:Altronate hydrolase n=1 Tax=Chitinophaga terrae (ex Kim and Jung 2007) TaxID=408074 RepID=A0A1H4DGQ2_9BACT|nr:altronate dehydratase family protein [Chitinophaga terrae (ex Kim and Jung 2007)]MDQ0107670.1 altronate hydrolase [Chitinophaga terrae (ex Kim and Jung 2007)]GEP92713.1 dehydratase [Chitinophaga terrae (ex Kim and Jung 2007)]SEA71935.1 altronate hydrolase [Chitinophaga terrae (ex Kim and Jung 2007)]
MNTYLQIHPDDNVLVALQDLPAGMNISHNGHNIQLQENIAAKHKFLIQDVGAGDHIIMYGVLVGKANQPIPKGAGINTGNVVHDANSFHEKDGSIEWKAPDVSKWANKTFMGYHRADGQVGTRNYWLVIPLVFCENRNVSVIKTAFEKGLGFAPAEVYNEQVQDLVALYKKGDLEAIKNYQPEELTSTAKRNTIFPNIDGIKFLTHEGGCGGTRQDSDALCALLAGYIHHSNVAGATILSLGCQHAQVSILQQSLKKLNPDFNKPVLVYEQQKSASEFAMLSAAIKDTFLALTEANKISRQPSPLSKLVIGLECGGSDGFSGISANPAVGHTSDLVVALGGTSILSEFPELCGVEQELINRCQTTEISDKFIRIMRAYETQAQSVGSGFYMNPSPGNIKDGLITDAIKSAGAAKKGGTSPVTDVLDYTEYVTKPGLNLLCTPGNDVESTSAEVGSGANVVLFTTGLGTPTGNPIAPVVKLATNTKLATRMKDIIDINTGTIISGEKSIEEMGEEILEYVIKTASGEVYTKAEQLNQDDFIPWKRGVSL